MGYEIKFIFLTIEGPTLNGLKILIYLPEYLTDLSVGKIISLHLT